MSASEAAGRSPSLARQDADAEPEPPQRSWVALVSTPRILAASEERALKMAIPIHTRTSAELDLEDPPRPSYLVLHPRIAELDPCDFAYQPSAYILAADRSGLLLFRVNKPGSDDPDRDDELLFLCRTSARSRRTTILHPVPYSDLGVKPQPRRSIGLIADTDIPGSYLVVQLLLGVGDRQLGCFSTATLEWFIEPLHNLIPQLCPAPAPSSTALLGDKLLCFSTDTRKWFVKPLHTTTTTTAVRMRNLCGETGVLAHAGRLYWLALAYGIFFCDPRAEPSHLGFVSLPDGCHVWEEEELSQINRAYVAQRRRVAPSEGHLRYVEILGLPYELPPEVAPPPVNPRVRMWTLVDPEAAQPWRFEVELEAPFAQVWKHESYAAFGLPHGEVPHVALVDPYNHRVVYFLQGSKLYGLDLRDRRVVSCEDCPVRDDREIMLRNSRPIIDAWEWSPPTPSSPAGLAETIRRRLIRYLESVPSTEEGQSSRAG